MFNFAFISIVLFINGSFSLFINYKNLIIVLISLELLLLASLINFVSFSFFFDDFFGQILGLLVLTVAAAETAIGLSIIFMFSRIRKDITIDFINLLKA